jgi:hypothetical protein
MASNWFGKGLEVVIEFVPKGGWFGKRSTWFAT